MKNDKKCIPKLCSIQIDNRELKYILTKSSRKTVGITIEQNGTVKVTSPFHVSENYINELLQRKSHWIIKKLNNIEIRAVKANKAKRFEEGEHFRLLGKEYRLKLYRSGTLKKPTIRLIDDNIIIAAPENAEVDKLKDSLKLWYIKQFKLVIADRIKYYSSIIDVCPKKITVREQKTRWGSCSSKGNINLNWKLIMASIEVLDYVVVHELCHMREMNHTKEFWKLVEGVLPQYKTCRVWLKENGDLLSIE